MAGPDSDATQADGSIDFSGGVDSLKVTTIQSAQNPNGLARNELAWLVNATIRDGSISPRDGWILKGKISPGNTIYQSGMMFAPQGGAPPYLLISLGGQIFQVQVDQPSAAVNLSSAWGASNPPSVPYGYMVQGEQFGVIQAGDLITLPLFWDGNFLRRSKGLLPNAVTSITPPTFNVTLVNVDSALANIAGSTTNSNPLGVPFTGFAVPAVGNPVVVTLGAAFGGNIGDNINFAFPATGQMHLQSIVVGPPHWKYTYKNLSIPAGTAVPAQFAPGVPAGDGANFPAFTAPAINSNVVFTFNAQLVNPGTQNTFTYSVNNDFTVTAITNQAGTTQLNVSELPAAGPMDYYMGRIWYAQNRLYTAGDIVGGAFGTAAYQFKDSILQVTENPLALGGDGFTVPAQNGNITALKHNAVIDTTLGQGQLFAYTNKAVYSLTVPVTRADWIAADNNNPPLQQVVQFNNGAANDRSVVPVNGDLYSMSLEPAIRSIISATRFYGQPGNLPLSAAEDRILQFVNRNLLGNATGTYFNNRLLQMTLPKQTAQGVVHQGVIPLDYEQMSQFGENLTPTWEGHYEGLDVLDIFTGVFSGIERCFALVVSRIDQSIELWEFIPDLQTDGADNRIVFQAEFPAFTWGDEFALKKLVASEFWFDRIAGTVDVLVEYRPDGQTCWLPWKQFEICSPRNSAESVNNPIQYPLTPCGPGYKSTVTLPEPPEANQVGNKRPANVGYQFQPRVTIKGYCRVRGILLHAQMVDRKLYENMV